MHSLDELKEALSPVYHADAELRQDGLGQRILARDADERPVIVTVLNSSLVRQMAPEAFVNSLRQAMVIRHPALLPIIDSGRTTSGFVYYVNPFPDGPPAQESEQERVPRPAAEVAAAGRRIAAALASLHVTGLVHGRINPRAVYLTRDGAVLADHGVYQALVGAGVPAPAILAAYGSSSHVSPEQAAGEMADERSDVYSLGATLYELLTGKPPFGGRTTSATLVSVLSDEPGERIAGGQTPGYVSRAILRAIEKQPDDRWESADAFGAALTDGEPVVPRKRRLGCLPAAVVICLTVLGALAR